MKPSNDTRICIPIPYERKGGMHTFLLQFRQWLEQKGITHTENIDQDYDILFVNSFMVPFRDIYKAKQSKSHIRIIQRVDGSSRDYGRTGDWDSIQARVNLLADLTIFQSQYSQISTTQKYKVVSNMGPIIYNPVNTDRFNPEGEKYSLPEGTKICVSAFSTHKLKGTWQIPELASANPDLQFILCGRYPFSSDLENVHILGHLDRDEIASVMRTCDVFLNLSQNDPCPNVVTEALSSGLPVLFIDSGGTPELVGDAGLSITVDTFRDQLDILLSSKQEYSHKARHRAIENYAHDVIFEQYWQAIIDSARSPIPSWKDWVGLIISGYDVWQISPSRITRAIRSIAKKLLRSADT